MKFEHKELRLSDDEGQVTLDRMGQAGWELVSVVMRSDGVKFAYFRRRMRSDVSVKVTVPACLLGGSELEAKLRTQMKTYGR